MRLNAARSHQDQVAVEPGNILGLAVVTPTPIAVACRDAKDPVLRPNLAEGPDEIALLAVEAEGLSRLAAEEVGVAASDEH